MTVYSKTKAKELEHANRATMSNQVVNIEGRPHRIFSIKGKEDFYCYPITESEAWAFANKR